MPHSPIFRPLAPRKARSAGAAVLAGAAVIALAACNTTPSGSDIISASPGGRTTITVWDQTYGPNTPLLDEMIADYNGSQDKYTVQHQFIAGGGDQFTPSILNAIKSGEGPNLVLSSSAPQTLGQIIETGKVLPLDDRLSSGPVQKSDFTAGMLAASTYDDKIYSLPTEGGNFAVFYNKKMFKEAGITDVPATWSELAEDAKKLTKGGTYGMYLPLGTGEWPSYTWQAMLQSAGGTLLNEDKTKATFNSQAGVKALSAWADMYRDGSAYPTSLADTTQAQGEPGFDAGKVAMFIGNVFNIPLAQKAIGEENVGVMALPKVGDKPGMMIGTNVSFLLDGTQEQEDGSWDFLSWFSQPEQQAKWSIATLRLPPNQKVLETQEWKEYLNQKPLIKVFADQVSYATVRPSITSYGEISAGVTDAINQALSGGADPKAALDAAADKANSILSAK